MAEGKPVKSRIGLMLGGVFVLILVGAGIFLATWNIPAPSTTVERVISNDKFSR
jgi:hypothetical protein